MDGPLIGVVEDEEHLAQGLVFNLEAEGYRTHHEGDGQNAAAWLLSESPQPAAIILDVMLPGRDGFSIVRALREAGRYTPVLLLTARGRSEDVVEGFASGADDDLTKPFDLNVLLARLKSLLRRMEWQGQLGPVPASEKVDGAAQANRCVSIGDRTVDFDALEIRGGPQPIRLTVMEADLLRYLIEHPDRVIPRRELLEEVWRVHVDTDTRPIDNFIVRLRRYVEPNPTEPRYLLTARGVGYRFVPQGD